MSEKRCVIDGCKAIGEHEPECDQKRCRGCLPRLVEHGFVCNPDRTRLAAWLQEIPALHAELEADPDPVDRHEWTTRQYRWIPTSDPFRRPKWSWVREPGEEPLARIIPMGITRTSHQARVSGSREAPVPINLDRFDLAYGRTDTEPKDRSEDQVGYRSAAYILDQWSRDWIETLCPDHHLPPANVAALVDFLSKRFDDACDSHPAIDEFAAEISTLRHAMRSVLGLTDAPKELCKGVVCRSCDRKALYREGGGYVTCGHCGQHYNDGEYTKWVRLLAGQAGRMAA